MTRPDETGIRERAESGTPGPWEWSRTEDGEPHLLMAKGSGYRKVLHLVLGWGVRPEDVDFIAHAREDIDALLAELATERARADALEHLLRSVIDAERIERLPGDHAVNVALLSADQYLAESAVLSAGRDTNDKVVNPSRTDAQPEHNPGRDTT